MRPATIAALVAAGLLVEALPGEAQVIHIVQPGDTPTSIAVQYYGDARRELVIRAVNGIGFEEETELAVGEPILVPERRYRLVAEGDTWESLARIELGDAERASYLSELNDTDVREQPEPGRVIVVPYLLPVPIEDGLPAMVERYYPDDNPRDMARLLRRLNPSLRARVPRGTRIVAPFPDLAILPSRRSELEGEVAARRGPEDAERQDEAALQLARLQDLLAEGAFAELVEQAGRVAGCADLTGAQQVRLHSYLGQAYVALDRVDLAEAEFRRLVALQPDFQFDQVTTSPLVIQVLERARRSAAPERPARGRARPVDGR